MTSKQKGESALFTAAFLYGFFGVLSKLINFQLPVFYQSWVRNIFCTLIIGGLVLLMKKWKPIIKTDYIWFFARSAFGFISFIAIFYAFTKLDIGTTYLLSYASSVVTGYILGLMVFKEKLTKRGLICFILSLIGLLFVYNVNINPTVFPFAFLAVISGIAAPGWSIFSKKISGAYSNLQINFIDSMYAAFFPFIVSIFVHETWVPIALTTVWIYTFLFGLMFLINGFLIVYGYSKVSAQAGTIIMLFEIIAGIILGFIFFHETLSFSGYFGGGLILSAIILRSLEKEHPV